MEETRRPNIPEGSHPLDTGEYKLPTPMIYWLSSFIKKLWANRVPGAIVHGRQRYGKTEAAKYLKDELKQEYGEEFPVFFIDLEYFNQLTQCEFYDFLLDEVGHKIEGNKREGKLDKRKRLITFLEHKAILGGQKRLVIFIDEAQNLNKNQYKWLNGIYNKLIHLRIRPLFLLFGQPELLTTRNNFITDKHTQIVGRYMLHLVEFKGLENAGDIATCLSGYDTAEFPAGSGWTMTKQYFPYADVEKWCLANEADNAWRAFSAVRIPSLIKKDKGISMLYFTLTVEYLLKTHGTEDPDFQGFTKEQWEEAVDFSGYKLATQITSHK